MPTPVLRSREELTRKKSASGSSRVKKYSSISAPVVRGRKIAEATEIAPTRKTAKIAPAKTSRSRTKKSATQVSEVVIERPRLSVRVAAPDTLALPAVPVGERTMFSAQSALAPRRSSEHHTSRLHHRVSFTTGLLVGSFVVGVLAVAYIALVSPRTPQPADIMFDRGATTPRAPNTDSPAATSVSVTTPAHMGGYGIGAADPRVVLDYFVSPTDPLAPDNLAVIDKIVDEYGAIVQVRLRPMVVRTSDTNMELVRALACASDMSKAWDMYRAIVNTQSVGRVDALVVAQGLDIPAGVFQECLDADVHKNDILDTYLQAKRLGVQQPPTLAVGDVLFPGALSFRGIEEKILALTQ